MTDRRREILDALDVRVKRPSRSWLYRAGTLGVALVMVLLPLIYVAVIVASAYGLYWHAVHRVDLLGDRRARIYFAGIALWSVLLVFLCKPLFAPRARPPERRELDPAEEPFLFQFVASLCRCVGAPPPRRILIDGRVNASAGFLHASTGISTRGRELTIGMPLVAGLTLRQFTGVLAHEFGHFAQGTAMRVGFLVHSIDRWFTRLVYGRDKFDAALEKWSADGWGWAGVLGHLAKALVWVSRRLLFALLWIGRVASSYSGRQMEYDADKFEVRVVGSATFRNTMKAMHFLGVGATRAHHVLNRALREDRLTEDLPALVMALAQRIPVAERTRMFEAIEQEPSHLFATHPRAIDRIRAAEAADEKGVFRVDAPARILFDDFDGACRAVTSDEYAGFTRLTGMRTVPAEELIRENDAHSDQGDAMRRFSLGTATPLRRIPVVDVSLDADPSAALAEARGAMLTALADYRVEVLEFVAALERVREAEIRIACAKAGTDPDLATARADRARAAAELGACSSRLEPFEHASSRRLRLALGAADRTRRAEVDRLLPALDAVGSALPKLVHVATDLRSFGSLVSSYDRQHASEAHRKTMGAYGNRLRERVQDALDSIDDLPFPFQHGEGELSLHEFLLPRVPSRTRPAELHRAVRDFIDGVVNLDLRIRGSLVEIAEEAEASLGLGPLEPPEVVE